MEKNLFLPILLIFLLLFSVPLAATPLPPEELAGATQWTEKTCQTIATAVMKYNVLEDQPLVRLSDLNPLYLTNIDTLVDPWENPFRLNQHLGIVYSCGADEQGSDDPSSPLNADNIYRSFVGAPALVKAKLLVNPLKEAKPDQARDVLLLTFNQPIQFDPTLPLNFYKHSAKGKSLHIDQGVTTGREPDPACPAYAFRWSLGSAEHYRDLPPETGVLMHFDPSGRPMHPDKHDCLHARSNRLSVTDPVWSGAIIPDDLKGPEGIIYESEEGAGIAIVLPAGTSGSFPASSEHFIDLTGTRCNEDDGRGGAGNRWFKRWDGRVGGQMRGRAVKIEIVD